MIPLLLIASGPRFRAVRVNRELVLGRHADCDVQLDHPSVSRRHARVVWQRDAALIEDLDSRNGTWLGGQRLHPQQRLALSDGQAMRLGDAMVRFCLIDDLPAGLNPRRGEELLAHLLTFECPRCGRRVGADMTMIGFVDRCPRCRGLLLVPPLEVSRAEDEDVPLEPAPSPIGEARVWEAATHPRAIESAATPSRDATATCAPVVWEAAVTATVESHDTSNAVPDASQVSSVPDTDFARTDRLEANDLLAGPRDAPRVDRTDPPRATDVETAHNHAAASGRDADARENQPVNGVGASPVDVPGEMSDVPTASLSAAAPMPDTMREQLRNRERDWWAISLVRRLPNLPNVDANGRPRA